MSNGSTMAKSGGLAALVVGCAFAASSQAAVLLPSKGGFSGYVNLGVGYADVKSNTLASIMKGNVELGKEQIDNLYGSPDNESSALPAVNFELSYTFDESRTQLFIGNLLEDFIRFDSSTILGVRQEVGSAGLIGASLLTTSIATEVWSDPYLTDAKRDDTDRTGSGYRLYWQQIMGSGLEVRYSTKEVDIDKERSGESLNLSSAQRKLLQRDGDNDRLDLYYEMQFNGQRHLVTPNLGYIDQDRDGEAMSNDGYSFAVNYVYTPGSRWRYVLNANYADLDWKKTNPIYRIKDSADRYGLSATVFFNDPFGLEKWALNGTAAYFEEDHDINFYDTSVTLFSVGMFRKF
jgi:hypothetical protein